MIPIKSIILLYNKEDYLRCLLIYSFYGIDIGNRLKTLKPILFPVYLRVDSENCIRRGADLDTYKRYILEYNYIELTLDIILSL